MKKAGQKYSESGLLLKSFCCVAGTAVFVLFFMHHAAPVRTGGKEYGSCVKLLLTENAAEADEFARWAELNKPSNVFGYNSKGLFTRAVNLKNKVVLPEVRGRVTEAEVVPLPEVPAANILPMGMEKYTPVFEPMLPESAEVARGFAASEIPVFSDKGEFLCKLEGFADAPAEKPLLLKADTTGLGTRFRVIESSGDTQFDSRVTAVLEQKIRSGSRFAGVIAVWPKWEKEK